MRYNAFIPSAVATSINDVKPQLEITVRIKPAAIPVPSLEAVNCCLADQFGSSHVHAYTKLEVDC